MLARHLRADPRVDVPRLVVRLADGSRAVAGNVSRRGVGFWLEGGRPIAPGEPFQVRLVGPEDLEPLVLAAAVRHAHFVEDRDATYVGGEFGPTDALIDGPLYRFVEERLLAELVA
jgi:hypothetical protein